MRRHNRDDDDAPARLGLVGDAGTHAARWVRVRWAGAQFASQFLALERPEDAARLAVDGRDLRLRAEVGVDLHEARGYVR